MTQSHLLVLLGNLLGLAGAAMLAIISGFEVRGIVPILLLMLSLDVWVLRGLSRNRGNPRDRPARD